MNDKKRWTELLSSDVSNRLANCCTVKNDILPLAQARWSWLKENKSDDYVKEDALVYVLELIDCNSVFIDLTKAEYNDILNRII